MSVQRLETLTNDPELLLRAKLALKAVHQWNNDTNFKYHPSPDDIGECVAKQLSGNAELQNADDLDLDALNRERKKVKELGVVEFLTRHGFVQALLPAAYWVPPSVAEYCPRLYE